MTWPVLPKRSEQPVQAELPELPAHAERNLPPVLAEHGPALSRERLLHMLEAVSRVKVGVIGDGCVDIYWHADMAISELSRETPHYPLPVVQETFSPGAAGNVAANLKALGCAEVLFCSVRGEDWRGVLLANCFRQLGIDDSYTTVEPERVTPAYCKPIRHGHQGASQEDARIDFANRTALPEPVESRLLRKLDEMAERVDAIAVTDQFACGVITPAIRERLRYWAKRGKVIGVDSRDRIALYEGEGIVLKPNELEAMRAVAAIRQTEAAGSAGPASGAAAAADAGAAIPGSVAVRQAAADAALASMQSAASAAEGGADAAQPWHDWLEAAESLRARSGGACCMTLGPSGSVWLDGGKPVWVPSLPIEPPYDIVGAGDCFMASLISALGAGFSGAEAMAFAHLSASIVIKKLGTTGTASPEEITARYEGIFANKR